MDETSCHASSQLIRPIHFPFADARQYFLSSLRRHVPNDFHAPYIAHRPTKQQTRTSSYFRIWSSGGSWIGAGSTGAGAGAGDATAGVGVGEGAAGGGFGVATRTGDGTAFSGTGVVPGFAGSEGCSGAEPPSAGCEPDFDGGSESCDPEADRAGVAGMGGVDAAGVPAPSLGAAAACAAFARAAAMRSACFMSCFFRISIRASSCLIFLTKSLTSPAL